VLTLLSPLTPRLVASGWLGPTQRQLECAVDAEPGILFDDDTVATSLRQRSPVHSSGSRSHEVPRIRTNWAHQTNFRSLQRKA
jgi:hypothetical protein